MLNCGHKSSKIIGKAWITTRKGVRKKYKVHKCNSCLCLFAFSNELPNGKSFRSPATENVIYALNTKVYEKEKACYKVEKTSQKEKSQLKWKE